MSNGKDDHTESLRIIVAETAGIPVDDLRLDLTTRGQNNICEFCYIPNGRIASISYPNTSGNYRKFMEKVAREAPGMIKRMMK